MTASERETLSEERAWALLLELVRAARDGSPITRSSGVRLDAAGRLELVPRAQAWLIIDAHARAELADPHAVSKESAELLELYLPLCAGDAAHELVIGHIGQTLDGQIATSSGASRSVTGPENIRHLHRLRALCDAIVVGRTTVQRDDPQLTTRLVPGASPVRVVIDPELRSSPEHALYRDPSVTTLVVCDASVQPKRLGHAQLVPVPAKSGELPPHEIVRALARRGLKRLFVEGGGVTISRFLAARALTRLHVAVCPIFIGKGSRSFHLPGIEQLEQALRPKTRRFVMGDDVLFDCDVREP